VVAIAVSGGERTTTPPIVFGLPLMQLSHLLHEVNPDVVSLDERGLERLPKDSGHRNVEDIYSNRRLLQRCEYHW
jgi:hypothetical protein